MKDMILFELELPWPLPDLKIAVVKSAIMRRWTVFVRWHIREATDGAFYYDYQWWLQLRAWWFPVYFFRGWIQRG